MKKSKIFLTVRTLKEERLSASVERQDEIDEEVKRLEPGLSHEEAVYIVTHYEMGKPEGSNTSGQAGLGIKISPSVEIDEWNAADQDEQGAPSLWKPVHWGRRSSF